VFKNFVQKTASPCRGGAELKEPAEFLFLMLLAEVTVVLPVTTAAQRHEKNLT
jgi:hypothetical protein